MINNSYLPLKISAFVLPIVLLLTNKYIGTSNVPEKMHHRTPPILYYKLSSPPCRSVLLTAKAIGIELEMIEVDLSKGENLSPEFLKLNPQHTVPVLNDDGTIIYDSHAICSYLCEKYAENHQFYPKDLAHRALVDARLHFDSGILYPRLRFLYEPILYGNSDVDQRRVEYFQEAWPIMEAFLQDTQYLCGHAFTIADFCCAATIESVNELVPIDPHKYPKLSGWLKRMEQFPGYEHLNMKGAVELRGIVNEAIKLNRLNINSA